MYYAPVLETGAFYRAESSVLQGETGGNITTTMAAAYNQAVTTLNQAETVSLAGAAVAPIGAAVLAYGLVAGKETAKRLPPEPAQSS